MNTLASLFRFGPFKKAFDEASLLSSWTSLGTGKGLWTAAEDMEEEDE